MSKPLWLMLGTAFAIEPPVSVPNVTLLLTAKHTFLPWLYVDAADKVKIPEEFRKSRYVIGKLYDPRTLGTTPLVSEEVGIASIHPTLDAALLVAQQRGEEKIAFTKRLTLNYEVGPTTTAEIVGFRGEGQLGELDTLDSNLLEKLPVEERNKLLKLMENVEGRHVETRTSVEIVTPEGMCRGLTAKDRCFHGMSGAPLISEDRCVGLLYGKHPQYRENYGLCLSRSLKCG
ncbi:hypothetical protein STCU_01583 [Strigomonas culicis]|uniref:Uncharacterized protein n=1 Tax=Strigomonas culicis TaxID=28005 RepID=S9WFD3_9TRYP|nr:hypothetical protein STCU_01583 [Strigomonas culicis]|eukprot:EPY34440.1 hypothetical protein STCU_01583 [Strigomonas culicis]